MDVLKVRQNLFPKYVAGALAGYFARWKDRLKSERSGASALNQQSKRWPSHGDFVAP